MDDIVANTNISNAVEDDKRGSSWIVISHSHRLSILKFISDSSPDALERLLSCFGCLKSEIFHVYKVVLSLVDPNAFIGTLDMERARSSVAMIKLQVLALQQPPENRFPISPKDGPRIQEYLEDVHYASHRAACEPLKLLSACVLNDLDIFGKVPDRVQNAKSNIGIINEIIEQTNIERGRRPEEGVIDLITLNHYWKLRRADSLHNKTEQKNFTDSNISIVRMLEQYPIGWKDLPISDLMCYKFDDDYYWKGFWDSVEPGRLDESQLITFIRTACKHYCYGP